MFKESLEYPPETILYEEKDVSIKETAERLCNITKELETAKNIDIFKELVPDFLDAIEVMSQSKLSEKIEDVYREMERDGLLLRVENISRIAESLKTHTAFKIGDDNDHYANSVIADNEGVKIAMAEASSPGPIRLLIGFDVRTAITFNPESMHVYEIDDDEMDLRDTSLRRRVCRHVSGEIKPEDIKHIIMRIPRVLFPKERMTKKENDTISMYIFRSVHM